MRRHWKYLLYVLRHKWFVFWAGIRLGVNPTQLIFHDWHKFTPAEWLAYARYFYLPDGSLRHKRDDTGYFKPADTLDADFDYAWLLHQKRGKHHWQWWVLPKGDGGQKVFPVPEKYYREMVADWVGAGKAQGYGDNTAAWYEKNKDNMILHGETRQCIEDILRGMR